MSLHTVEIVSTEGVLSIKFTCTGTSESKCHQYPDCGCESWHEDHDHPFVAHDQCWLQDWFDNGGITPAGDDISPGDLAEAGYVAGMTGPVTTSFCDDYIEWEFVPVVAVEG